MRKVLEVPLSSMTLVPPEPGLCQECATDHRPNLPHNAQSIYYQTKFQMEHGRAATWNDAMEHCSDKMKDLWIEKLRDFGIEVSK